MASTVENSIFSLPIPIPDLTQLQAHLLEQREAPSTVDRTLTQSPHTRQKTHDARQEVVVQIEACLDDVHEIAEPTHTIDRTISSPKFKRNLPPLQSSKTAPAAIMDTMLSQPISQGPAKTLMRAESSPGFPGGDTQPMDTQVYRDYTTSMFNLKSNDKTPVKSNMDHIDVSSVRTGTTERSPHTYTEGDTGFVNLARDWQPASPTARSQGSVEMDELLEEDSPQTQFQVPEVPSIASVPKTPSMAGNKHDRSGKILTSEPTTSKRTPGFSQLFGGNITNGPLFSATQLFEQTQAPSSPISGAPRSDPVVSRPSPNMNQNLGLSSPTAPATSPFIATHGRPPSHRREPRDKYASTRESQKSKLEQRSAQPGSSDGAGGSNERATEVKEHGEDDHSDDDEDSLRRKYEQLRSRKLLSEQAQSDWARLRAPSRPGSRPVSAQKPVSRTTIDLVTPARHEVVEFDIPSSDGMVDADMSDADEDDTHSGSNEGVADDGEGTSAEIDDGDDTYDELGQTVLRSQGFDEAEDEQPADGQPEQDITGMAYPEDELKLQQHHWREEAMTRESSEQAAEELSGRIGTQRSAIADSQNGQHGLPRPKVARHPSVPSPRSSYVVPGSQYTGKTSEEQAPYSSNQWKKSSKESSTKADCETVPSSPPVPVENSTLPGPTSSPRGSVRDCGTEQLDAGQHEIPESDLPDATSGHADMVTVQAESNNGVQALFSTARTHISTMAPSQGGAAFLKSPVKTLASQRSRVSSPSPRRAAGVRHFADIVMAEASQPQCSAETEVDVDDLLGNIITNEDQDFMGVSGSVGSERVQKRRKTTADVPAEKLPRSNTENPASPAVLDRVDGIENAVGEDENVLRAVELETSRTNVTGQVSSVLRDSPSKANEALPEKPADASAPTGTQDSVKKREAAGANAVAQLLSSSRAKSAVDAKRSSEKAERSKLRGAIRKPTLAGRKVKTNTRTGRMTAKARMMTDSPEQDEQAARKTAPAQVVSKGSATAPEVEEVAVQSVNIAVTAPNRILAFFPGQATRYNNYYPATWLSMAADGHGYRVRFDDDTIRNVPPDQVCSLSLRIGDSIKELHLDGCVQACVVQGYGPVAHTDEERALGTDQHGRTSLRVRAKAAAGRTSTFARIADSTKQSEVQDILITNIYVTRNMWPHFKNRTFTPPESNNVLADRAGTPLSAMRLSDDGTPTSRTRRAGVSAGNTITMLGFRDESVTSMSSRSTDTLFVNMAFALSFGKNDGEKKSITQHIQRNGGLILEHEFDGLFDIPDCELSGAATSASKAHTEGLTATVRNNLRLKSQYQNLGFVALITDGYSRRAKYIQALSLGLPTLSGRWIHDSVSPAKNSSLHSIHATTLDWAKYLLPAGESAYLGNVVRSRTMPVYAAADAKLADTIANRDNLLGVSGVLLVIPRKGAGNKALWQRHKQFAFLTLALGAGAVRRIDDLVGARTLIRQEPEKWKWVYVDGDVEAAQWQLSGKKGARPKTKSKAEFASCASGNGVMVVGDEFVIQSLILGALVD